MHNIQTNLLETMSFDNVLNTSFNFTLYQGFTV